MAMTPLLVPILYLSYFFLAAMINYPEKSNLREKTSILIHTMQSIMADT